MLTAKYITRHFREYTVEATVFMSLQPAVN